MKSYFGSKLKEIRDRGAYNSGTLASLHSAFRNVGRTLLDSTDMNATCCSARNFTCSETSSIFITEVTNTPTISGTPLAPNSATDERESANTSDLERLSGELAVPVYRLNRSLTTFKQIWDEYIVGLGNGPGSKGFGKRL
jgi:hypothetical protein